MSKTEEELWKEVTAGNERAFGQLVRGRHEAIFRLLYGFVRDETAAEELAQETWIKVWEKKQTFRGESSVRTWIHRIATRKALDFLRKRQRQRKVFFEGDPEVAMATIPQSTGDAAKRAELNETRQLYEKALAALPEKLRSALVLREVEGLSYQEIAEVLQCRQGTVMSRLFNARRSIREFLAQTT